MSETKNEVRHVPLAQLTDGPDADFDFLAIIIACDNAEMLDAKRSGGGWIIFKTINNQTMTWIGPTPPPKVTLPETNVFCQVSAKENREVKLDMWQRILSINGESVNKVCHRAIGNFNPKSNSSGRMWCQELFKLPNLTVDLDMPKVSGGSVVLDTMIELTMNNRVVSYSPMQVQIKFNDGKSG